MSIKKPYLYSGLAIGALTLSTGGVYGIKVEQARTDIRDTLITMNAARKEAETNAFSSTDPATKLTELEICDARYNACGGASDAKLGMRATLTGKAFAECETIIKPDFREACKNVVMRGLISTSLSTASDYPKCIKGVTECYGKIKPE